MRCGFCPLNDAPENADNALALRRLTLATKHDNVKLLGHHLFGFNLEDI